MWGGIVEKNKHSGRYTEIKCPPHNFQYAYYFFDFSRNMMCYEPYYQKIKMRARQVVQFHLVLVLSSALD